MDIELTDDLLEYVDKISMNDCFDFVEDDDVGVFTVPSRRFTFMFKHRYNTGELKHTFKYNNYLKNDDIQNTLIGLDLNPQKFWFLLLYIFDYTYNICIDGVGLSKTPKEEITEFINMILANSTICEDGKLTEPMELTLKVGKKKLVINSPNAINYLTQLCIKESDSMNNTEMRVVSSIESDNESNSVYIWSFSNLFLSFLDLIPNKRSKDSIVSFSKLLLISRLVHFSRLATTKNYLESDEIIKAYLKQYKDYEIKNKVNNMYFN